MSKHSLLLLLSISSLSAAAEIDADRNEYLCRIDAVARDEKALWATDDAGLPLRIAGSSEKIYYLADYRRLTKSLEEHIRSADRFTYPGEMLLAASKVYECAYPGAQGKGYCDRALTELKAYVEYEGFEYIDYIKTHCEHGDNVLDWSKEYVAHLSYYLE